MAAIPDNDSGTIMTKRTTKKIAAPKPIFALVSCHHIFLVIFSAHFWNCAASSFSCSALQKTLRKFWLLTSAHFDSTIYWFTYQMEFWIDLRSAYRKAIMKAYFQNSLNQRRFDKNAGKQLQMVTKSQIVPNNQVLKKLINIFSHFWVIQVWSVGPLRAALNKEMTEWYVHIL